MTIHFLFVSVWVKKSEISNLCEISKHCPKILLLKTCHVIDSSPNITTSIDSNFYVKFRINQLDAIKAMKSTKSRFRNISHSTKHCTPHMQTATFSFEFKMFLPFIIPNLLLFHVYNSLY